MMPTRVAAGGYMIRLPSLAGFLGALAAVVLAHRDLLHFGELGNDAISLLAMAYLAANNPVVSKMKERTGLLGLSWSAPPEAPAVNPNKE